MPPAQQETLELGCKAAMLDGLALGEAIQFPVMKENLEKKGVENRYWSPELLGSFQEKWAEVVGEQSAEDPEFKAIWDNLNAFRADYAIWNEWAFLPRPGTVRKPAKQQVKVRPSGPPARRRWMRRVLSCPGLPQTGRALYTPYGQGSPSGG